MRLCITGDWHLDINNRFEDSVDTLKRLVKKVVEEKPDYFLFLGDAYHTWRCLPVEQYYFHMALLDITNAGIQTIVLVGNHDVAESEVYESKHCFTELKTLKPSRIQVIDAPTTIKLSDKVSGIFIPHIMKSNIKESYPDTFNEILDGQMEIVGKNKDKIILFSHVYLAEAKIGTADMIVSGNRQVSVKDIEKRGIVLGFFSDIHKSQKIGQGSFYPGSITRVDFGEASDPKGFITYDSFTDSVGFIDLHSRVMDEVTIDLVDPGFVRADGKNIKEGSIDSPVEKPLEYIYDALSVKDQLGYQFKDSIVKVKLICTKEQKALLEGADEKIATFLIDTIGIHSLKSISYEITDSVSVRNAAVNESLKPAEALDKWIEMQSYKEDTGTQVRIAGEKIIKG